MQIYQCQCDPWSCVQNMLTELTWTTKDLTALLVSAIDLTWPPLILLIAHDLISNLPWPFWLHMTDQWPPLTLLTDRPDLSWPYCMTWPLLTLLIAHDLISNLPWPCWLHMTWPVTSLDIADRPDLSWPYCMTWPQLTLLHDLTSVDLTSWPDLC